MTAPLATPQYISYATNVQPLVGSDKVLVSDIDSTGISTAEANALIANGEQSIILMLEPYYIVSPFLQDTNQNIWTNALYITFTNGVPTVNPSYPTVLSYYTAVLIQNMMIYNASATLIRGFIERNTDAQRTLSEFMDLYQKKAENEMAKVRYLLPNGSFGFQLNGLNPNPSGIPRQPARYARSGQIGRCNNYSGNQLTNPQRNFNMGVPFFWNNH